MKNAQILALSDFFALDDKHITKCKKIKIWLNLKGLNA